MTETLRRWTENKYSVFLGVVLALAAVGLFVYTLVSSQDTQGCFARWAQNLTDRTNAISKASNDRADALDTFIRTLITKDRAKELAAYNAYLKASDKYKVERAKNPVPPSPLHC